MEEQCGRIPKGKMKAKAARVAAPAKGGKATKAKVGPGTSPKGKKAGPKPVKKARTKGGATAAKQAEPGTDVRYTFRPTVNLDAKSRLFRSIEISDRESQGVPNQILHRCAMFSRIDCQDQFEMLCGAGDTVILAPANISSLHIHIHPVAAKQAAPGAQKKVPVRTTAVKGKVQGKPKSVAAPKKGSSPSKKLVSPKKGSSPSSSSSPKV